MNAPTKPLVLVTGDIVLDCDMYGGVRTAATSLKEPGTTYAQQFGGAALTHKLLDASAAGSYDVRLGLQRPDLKSSDRYGQLRSYGVWSDHPAGRGAKDKVWRLARDFGYGPSKEIPEGGLYTPDTANPRGMNPILTVIDDGGILFRNDLSSAVWPALDADGTTHFLLKMSPPLCRGDLWAALKPVMSRLIVVVSAADLRREDAKVSKRLSWEQCTESTLHALKRDSVAGELLSAAHVIVNFRSGGALWIAGAASGGATRLIFDHLRLEDDFDQDFTGTVYGAQTCLVVGIAHRLMAQHLGLVKIEKALSSPFEDAKAMPHALEGGIVTGLSMRRRLLELGHGPVKPGSEPGFPVVPLATLASEDPKGFIAVNVPGTVMEPGTCPWAVLAESELIGPATTPLVGLAHQTARYGFDALSHVPALKLGKLFVIDRSEIESLRTLYALIRDYEHVQVQEKPLCIGVFGPPGAGKSFGVKALATGVLGDKLPPGEKVPILEFNLSQFQGPDDLIGAFHRVRDAVLKGITPVAFWDEFDSQHYRWLQYLLAPMQDGAFQEGQVTHPIGKCIFVFAGGTSATIDEFGVPQQNAPAHREFKQLKGPDFISRLHGFLNVLGVNPRKNGTCPDITWPIRRALTLRSILKLKENEELNIDLGLLHALISTPEYVHGARSLEKIAVSLMSGKDDGRLYRAALPPEPILSRETRAAEFGTLMNVFKTNVDIDKLAAIIHKNFLDGEKKAALDAKVANNKDLEWNVHSEVRKEYARLSADLKASNRAAALRVPDLLVLINFVVKELQPDDDDSWMEPLRQAIDRHVDRLARAEHLGWSAERRANGWSYAEIRDNDRKHHPLLVDWSKLSEANREKDRHSARSIPGLLKEAKLKAVPVPAEPDVT